jgi:23S rRNA pseudouridine2605 synthase
MEERIQKILSRCGIASRRKAEEMILHGEVTVNGRPAVPGMKADIEKDHIKVRGKLVRVAGQKVYLMFHKPAQCITSLYDPKNRKTIKDFLKGVKSRVFPVGRLDYHSEGLVLLTNDGELANSLLHPKHKVPKTYRVKVDGILEDRDVSRLERGVKLEEGMTAPVKIKKIKKTERNSWIEIIMYEGKKRQIRRMLERVGYSVIKLRRIRVNGLLLGTLPPGKYRYLTKEEIKMLRKEVAGH